MRITVDTNILISATFWKGNSFRIIEKVENKELELVLSKDIIKEFIGVLNYEEIQDKIKDKNLEMQKTVEDIISISIVIEPQQKFDIIKDDVKDNIIIESAFEGKVDYIITKDKHLLKLKEFRSIKIISPEEFLKLFD
ncbi:MAG: putative toxin-antitoxin system toxin component, PIN family [archaeon]